MSAEVGYNPGGYGSVARTHRSICEYLALLGQYRPIRRDVTRRGESHRENGIAIQARHFGPHLPVTEMATVVEKSKRGSVDVMLGQELPHYNTGNRKGPPRRTYVEVKSFTIETDVKKENLLWICVFMLLLTKQ